MERNIFRSLAPQTREVQALYTPTIIWVDSDSNNIREDKSPLAVLIALTALVALLLGALILVGLEAWKRSTGRRPMFKIPGIDYIATRGGYDDERVSVPLNTIHTRPRSDIPATPTVIPPTPLPPVHLGEPNRIDEKEFHSRHTVDDSPPPRGFVRPQQPAESSDSLDSALGEVHHGRRVSLPRVPASLHSSSFSMNASRSGSHPLSIFRSRVKEDADATHLMEAHNTGDNSRDPGDLTIFVSPPTPSTSNSSPAQLPASSPTLGKKSSEFSLNRTARQVNSRHTLLINDLEPASNGVGKIEEAYKRAAYDAPEDLFTLATSQRLNPAPSYPNHGNHTDSFLALPPRNEDPLAQVGRLPTSEDRFDPEDTDPFRMSPPKVLPLALTRPPRSRTTPTLSPRRKVSMHGLVRHMMTMPTSNSQLSVAHSGAPLRSYFSPSSTILPLPENNEEESFLAKSTAAVKKVWKSALGFGLGRKAGSESCAEEREEILNHGARFDARKRQHHTRTTSLPELRMTKPPSSAGRKFPEEPPSLNQLALDLKPSIALLPPAHEEATPKSPMADNSNLSEYYTPAANVEDLKKMKALTSQPLRTPSKLHHHAWTRSSPFFLQAAPRVVPVQETRDVIGDVPASKQEQPGHALSETNESPNSMYSALSDDRSTSMLLSSAGLWEFPSPPLHINFRNHKRKSSEFTLDRDYHRSEPARVDREPTTVDARPLLQETSIYDEWNSYLPTSPQSLEDLDPRLFERSNLSIPIKPVQLSGEPSAAGHRRHEDGEDGEMIGPIPADRGDRGRPDASFQRAFTPFQTSTPVKSMGRRNPSERLG